MDILHFRCSPAFSNYLRLVRHHVEDGSGIGVVVHADFSVKRLPRPTRLVLPAILKTPPSDIFDTLISKSGDQLTGVEAALLNVLAWWRRAKQETDPTYKFSFLWFAIESGIPANEHTEGAFQRRIGMLAGYPTNADLRTIQSEPAAAAIYQVRDVNAGKKLKHLIKTAYKIRCDIVHQGASHTSTLADVYTELEQVASLFSYVWVPTLAGMLVIAAQRGLTDVADAWDKIAVSYIFAEPRSTDTYAPPFLTQFDLDSSRLFRW